MFESCRTFPTLAAACLWFSTCEARRPVLAVPQITGQKSAGLQLLARWQVPEQVLTPCEETARLGCPYRQAKVLRGLFVAEHRLDLSYGLLHVGGPDGEALK